MTYSTYYQPRTKKHRNRHVGRFFVCNVSDQKWHVLDKNGHVLDTATYRYDAIKKAERLEKAANHLDSLPKKEINKRLAFFEFNHMK